MKGSQVALTINGIPFKVPDTLRADTSLNEFIRTEAHLKGTKFMCLEGGCGACIVTVTKKDAASGIETTFAVNSCLTPIFACHGWTVTTIEGVGSKMAGYDKVQSRLASFSGTQCGYCSPGMVMNMHSLLRGNEKTTMEEVENAFGGNLCRCTGYRPILDAFKSLCADAPKNFYPEKCADIEDFPKICPKTEEICKGLCHNQIRCQPIDYLNDYDLLYEDNFCLELKNNIKWYKILNTREIFEIFDMIADSQTYKLVAGNTAHGVYRDPDFNYYLDISGVPELHNYSFQDSSLKLGANLSLTKTMNIFKEVSGNRTGFVYLKGFAHHIDLIANVPVRNAGTIAGNLSIKNQHKEFPSDIYLMFVTVNALFTYETPTGSSDTKPVEELINFDLQKKLITSFSLPALNDSYVVKTYKIMPRAQNAHAYVNAGFKFKFDNKKNLTVAERPNVIFGGIKPNFIHASQTESFLTGKSLLNSEVIQEAFKILNGELNPDAELLDADPAYRKGLAQSLFYKFVLSLSPETVNARLRSGGEPLVRPMSSGKQTFDTDKTVWPVNKPIPKIEAYAQCSGEAEFSYDVHAPPGELFGALVTAPKGPGTLSSIVTDDAMKMEGVKCFFSAKDIPGKNSSVAIDPFITPLEEPLFADKEILFAGQPVGILIATSQSLANKAAKKVKVVVTDAKKPLLTTKEVLDSGDKSRIQPVKSMERKEKNVEAGKNIVKGTFEIKEQYHFTMETQSCLAVPTEEGLEIYPTSQHLSGIQEGISAALLMPENCVNVQNRRLGGAYGCKISRNGQVSIACALAAYILRKPVRMALLIETNMQSIGKRFPCLTNYEAAVDNDGKIQYLNLDVYQDLGCSFNENVVGGTLEFLPSCYDPTTWTMKGYAVKTDKSHNTWARAPGSAEGVATIEHIMEHIAHVVHKDPLQVRSINFSAAYKDQISKMIQDLKTSSDFENRKGAIDVFNEKNRWRKKGISIVPLRYGMHLWGNFHALVSVYRADGTVSISHGGIEMGQGLNTKAVQTCAYKLGIDVNMIRVKPSNVLTAPNNTVSGGSVTSEAVSLAVIKCCDQLLERLAPFRNKMKDNYSWKALIAAAATANVDLNATFMFTKDATDSKKATYDIYGVTVTEVEVDVLTGNYLITRCDIIEDAGRSLSPDVDIGQVEGAFCMGLGYWLTEKIIFDPETGAVLTDRTWNYKPPGAKDIPADFRVTLLKNSLNPDGVLRSKATGEPPLCMSVSVIFALRQAIKAALSEVGKSKDWVDIKTPFSPEKVFLACYNGTQDYKL